MATKRQRDALDALTSRVYLFLLGASFLAVGVFALSLASSPQQSFSVMGCVVTLFAVFGVAMVFASVVASNKRVIDLAADGSHEILIIYILLAIGIARLLKRAK